MKEKGKRKRNTALIIGEIVMLLLIAYVILCFEADSERILPHGSKRKRLKRYDL